jgi:hypothetical protein
MSIITATELTERANQKIVEPVPGSTVMRDTLAALLRARGYRHDDVTDPYDMHWFSDRLGVRPLLACVAYEMSCEAGETTPGWDTYDVSIARPPA